MQLREYILHALSFKSDRTTEDLIKAYSADTKDTSNSLSLRTAIVEAISKLLIEQKIYKKFSQADHSFGQTVYYLNGNLQTEPFNVSLANLELRQVVTLALAELLTKFQEKCLRIQVVNLAFLCYELSSKGSCYKQLNILAEKGFVDIIPRPNGPIKLSYPIGTGLNFLKQTQPTEYARIVEIAKEQIKFEDAALADLIPAVNKEFSLKEPEPIENVEVIKDVLSEANASEAIGSFFSEYETLLQQVLELKTNNTILAEQLQSIQLQLATIQQNTNLEEIAICRSAIYNFTQGQTEQNIVASWVYNVSTQSLVELDFGCPNLLLSLNSLRQVDRDLRLEIEQEISSKAYLTDSSVEIFQQIKPY